MVILMLVKINFDVVVWLILVLVLLKCVEVVFKLFYVLGINKLN